MRYAWALLIVWSFAFCAACLGATDQNVSEQFAKAADETDLKSQANRPFEMEAEVEVFGVKQSSHGNYRLLWASPNKWREDIVFNGYRRTRIGGDGKYWQERSIDYELIPIRQLDEALDFNSRLRSSVVKVTGKMKTEKTKDTTTVSCAVLKERYEDEDFCFDPTGGQLVLEKLPNGAGGADGDVRARQYTDFVKFGEKLFPQSVRVIGADQPLVSFSLKKLAPLGEVQPSDFVAKTGEQEWITKCSQLEKPELQSHITPIYPGEAKARHEQGRVVVYALIGADGILRNLKLVVSVSPLLDASALQAVSKWQYTPRKCDGVPTQADTFIDLNFNVN